MQRSDFEIAGLKNDGDRRRSDQFESTQLEWFNLDSGQLNPAVVEELYAQYATDLRAFLLGLLRNPDWAAEALQSTFVKAAESGHQAQAETVRGWLFRVAYHQAMLLRRKQQVDQRATRQVAWNANHEFEAPDAGLLRREQIERVKHGLEKLPAEQRTVVRLRIYEEKTFAEIASELGIPLGTVVTRMRTALEKLNRELGER